MGTGRRGWGGGSSLCARDSSRGLAPKSSNRRTYSHLIFEGVSAGLGLWSMPPQQLGALSPLGWVYWGGHWLGCCCRTLPAHTGSLSEAPAALQVSALFGS